MNSVLQIVYVAHKKVPPDNTFGTLNKPQTALLCILIVIFCNKKGSRFETKAHL